MTKSIIFNHYKAKEVDNISQSLGKGKLHMPYFF